MGRKRRGRAKIDGIGIYSEWEFNKGVKVWEGNREEVKESKTTTTTTKKNDGERNITREM